MIKSVLVPRAEEILKKFILRARRIQAHSLVQDQNKLRCYAEGELHFELSLKGAKLERYLPENVEVFESLAARIRPITVKSESIYYAKIFEAIDDALGGQEIDEDTQKQKQDLLEAWGAAEVQGRRTRGYSIQAIDVDGEKATAIISAYNHAAAS